MAAGSASFQTRNLSPITLKRAGAYHSFRSTRRRGVSNVSTNDSEDRKRQKISTCGNPSQFCHAHAGAGKKSCDPLLCATMEHNSGIQATAGQHFSWYILYNTCFYMTSICGVFPADLPSGQTILPSKKCPCRTPLIGNFFIPFNGPFRILHDYTGLFYGSGQITLFKVSTGSGAGESEAE